MSYHQNRLPPVMTATTIRTNTVQPVVIQQPYNRMYIEREWSHKLCGCCDDIKECCCAYFCTICYACQIAKRINEPCWSICCGGMVPMRTKIRSQRKIKGTICKDYCALTFCPFCAVVQMGMEAKETGPLI